MTKPFLKLLIMISALVSACTSARQADNRWAKILLNTGMIPPDGDKAIADYVTGNPVEGTILADQIIYFDPSIVFWTTNQLFKEIERVGGKPDRVQPLEQFPGWKSYQYGPMSIWVSTADGLVQGIGLPYKWVVYEGVLKHASNALADVAESPQIPLATNITRAMKKEIQTAVSTTERKINSLAKLWRGKQIRSILATGTLLSETPNGSATNYVVIVDGLTNQLRCIDGIVDTVNHFEPSGAGYSLLIHTNGVVLMYDEWSATNQSGISVQLHDNGKIESYNTLYKFQLLGLNFFLNESGGILFATNYLEPVDIVIKQ